MNPDFLEAHAIAGGDIKDLVDGLLFIRENNMKGDAGHIATRQLLSTNAGIPPLIEQLTKLLASGIHDAGHGLEEPLSKEP